MASRHDAVKRTGSFRSVVTEASLLVSPPVCLSGADRFVERLIDFFSLVESVLGQGGMVGEDVVFRDQDVGMTVARQINEALVRVVPSQVGQGAKRGEGRPTAIVSSLVEAGCRAAEIDNIDAAIASEIEKLVGSEIAGADGPDGPFRDSPFAPEPG
jgi:hypothetical protein